MKEERMDHLLQIRDLQISALGGKQPVPLLDKVSLNMKKGQCLGIVGESGCGKSITANALLGLLPYPLSASGGTAHFLSDTFGEVDLLGLPQKTMRSIRGREIAMIFQEPMTSLDPVFPVQNQMYEAISFHNSKASNDEMRERCLQMLAKVNIPRPQQTLDSYPHQLSGGQLQRIMIAIALMNNPRLLIADEPTTALDVTIQAQILDLLRTLKDKINSSIMLITHDLGVIAEMADYVVVMYAGRVVEQGTAQEVFLHPVHPYTIGLMASKPIVNREVERLYSIPGSVPNPINMPEFCYFKDRCQNAYGVCEGEYPPIRFITPTHSVACYPYEENEHAKQD